MFYEPGFMDKEFFFGKHGSGLKQIYPDFFLADSSFLSTNRLDQHFDVLIFPYGGYFPHDSWPKILDFIRKGKDIITLGTGPFSSPCRKECGKWEVNDPFDFGDRWRWSFTSISTGKLGLSFWEVPDKSVLSNGNYSINIEPGLAKYFHGKTQFGCKRFTGTLNPLYTGRRKVVGRSPEDSSTAYDMDEYLAIVEPGFSREINGRFVQAGFLPDENWTMKDFKCFIKGMIDVLKSDEDDRLAYGMELSGYVTRKDSGLRCSCWQRGGGREMPSLNLTVKNEKGTTLSSFSIDCKNEMSLPVESLPEGIYHAELHEKNKKLVSSQFSVLPPRPGLPQVKVCRRNGYAALDVDGQIIPALAYAFNPYDRALDDLSRKFSERNINIHHFLYPLVFGWEDESRFDWTSFDRLAERILKNDPQGLLYPRVFLQTPAWWDADNQDEMKVYRNGSNFKANYVFNDDPLHANSKYSVRGFNRRMYGASWQSEKWRRDLCNVLKNFIEHVRKSVYRGNFFGCFICCGQYGEWVSFSNDNGCSWEDLSRPALRDFRSWLKKQYGGDDSKRRNKWECLGNISSDEIRVPATGTVKAGNDLHNFLDPDNAMKLAKEIPPAQIGKAVPPNFVRRHISKYGIFRDPNQSWDTIEYYRYWQDSFVETVSCFANAVKDASDGRSAVGMFIGYLMREYMQDLDSEYHQNSFLKILKGVRSIDIATSPYHYYRRFNTAEADANLRTVPGSINLSDKIFISENDQRTCVGEIGEYSHMLTGEADLAETLEAIKRNFVICMCHGTGLWWYDFGRGWYDHPDIMKTIGRCATIYRKLISEPNPCPAIHLFDVLNIIYSTKAYDYISSCSMICHSNTTIQVQEHFNRIGLPWEVYFLEDLPSAPPSKAYLFLNTCAIDDEDRKFIDKNLKKDGNLLIWLYAPGLYRNDVPNPENSSELTGIKLDWSLEKKEIDVKITDFTHPITRGLSNEDLRQFTSVYEPGKESLSAINAAAPEFFCVDKDATILGVNSHSGRPAFAVKEFDSWKSVYISCPLVPHNIMRRILVWGGLKPVLDSDDALYTNSDIIGIRAKEAGIRNISLREDFEIADLYGSEKYKSKNGKARINLKRGETFIGRISSAEDGIKRKL
ncbi:MAG TPA: hypothetical protein DCZ94_18800 [Lentisphaeria bacterium]|nr:hypothetical protein [Lentisphaeria bacterium]